MKITHVGLLLAILAAAPSISAAQRDTTRSTRKSAIIGGTAGAVVGGLAAAGYILNATAYDCVQLASSGSHCSKRSRVVLHSTVITAGAVAGAAGGAWIGRRVAAWWHRRASVAPAR